MSVRAPVGSVNICDQQSIIGRGLSAIRPMQGVNADYLYFFFKVNEEKIASLGTGSTFKAITQEVLKKVKIPLPPLEDQIRIAHLLGKVESLIAQRKKDIELLDQLLKSVFLEMFGDPVRNEKGWEKSSLSQITEQVVDCPHSTPKWTDKGIICLRTSNLGHGAWNWDDTRYVDETQYHQRISRSEIVPGDIILSREGTVGVLALVRMGMKLCMGQRLVQVRANQKKIVPLFLLHLLLMELAPERIKTLMAGSTSQHLNMKDLRALSCMVPPIHLQIQFAFNVEKLEILKSLYQKNLSDLEILYGTLSQKAFKGELDLTRVSIDAIVQIDSPIEMHSDIPNPSVRITDAEPVAVRAFTRKDIDPVRTGVN